MRYRYIQDVIHFLMCLTYSQTTDSIAVQVQLFNGFCMLDTDLIYNTALVDAKQQLVSGREFKRSISVLQRFNQRVVRSTELRI